MTAQQRRAHKARHHKRRVAKFWKRFILAQAGLVWLSRPELGL